MKHDEEVAELTARAEALVDWLRHARYAPSGDTSHAWHMDWLDRGALLARHLSAALTLADANEYASALTVIRTALEHHLTDRLITSASRYEHEVIAPTDEDADRMEREYEELVKSSDSDVQTFRRGQKLKSRRRFWIVRHAPRFSEHAEQWLSMQGVWAEQYDPFAGHERHQEHVEGAFMDLDDLKRLAREAIELWERVFSFRGLRSNLTLNELITDTELLQVEIHYAFLSAFAHATNASYEAVFGRNRPRVTPAYDHYASELVTLYVMRIVELELRLLADALARPPACGLDEWNAIEAELDRSARDIEYFWFLGGGPTDADRARAANHLMARSKPERPWEAEPIDPASLEPSSMPYARNPLRRLLQLHESWQEFTTRVGYRSPWERSDARWRT